jgi:aldose 1-epimerase
MSHSLQAPWRAVVHHEVELLNTSLRCTLTVHSQNDMPAMVGWHPWFVRPRNFSLEFSSMLERGADYLPTGKHTAPIIRDADDCFIDPIAPLTLHYPNISLTLQSDCSHWVVYDQPAHAMCVEPQSGPPNEVNDAPHIVRAGESMQRHFTISW